MITQINLKYVNEKLGSSDETEFACGLPVILGHAEFNDPNMQDEWFPLSVFDMIPELNEYNRMVAMHFGNEVNFLRYLIASLEKFR